MSSYKFFYKQTYKRTHVCTHISLSYMIEDQTQTNMHITKTYDIVLNMWVSLIFPLIKSCKSKVNTHFMLIISQK